MKDVYQRIRDLREDHDKTQKDIAKILKISNTMYQRYEYKQSEIPARHIITLSKYYNISADYILGLSNKKRPPE